MNAHAIDLTAPSVRAARHLAHLECLAHGPEAAKSLMARLLMHVEVDEGGFLGADDWRAHDVRKRFGINPEQYAEAVWAPGAWPVAQTVAA